jgi:hypothetical protein
MALKTQDFFVFVGVALTMVDSLPEISPETVQFKHGKQNTGQYN